MDMKELGNLNIDRSIKFVSLDTHPANNSLVVTYENHIVIINAANGQELTRRNKRDQFQMKISALDKDNQTLDLDKTSEEIVRNCPMLRNEHHILENIRLNLVYLLNRKQSSNQTSTRPLSSNSLRLRSTGSSARAGQRLARQMSASNQRYGRRFSAHSETNANGFSLDSTGDTYDSYLQKEGEETYSASQKEIFLRKFEERLCKLEAKVSEAQESGNSNLDAHLEGLYGEPQERAKSILFIRRLARDELQLTNVLLRSDNINLLLCALLRTLRDLQQQETHLVESILYCLIKLSGCGEEISMNCLFQNANNSLDLVEICLNLLGAQASILQLNQIDQIQDRRFSIASLLIIIENLLFFQLETEGQTTLSVVKSNVELSLQRHSEQIVSVLESFFALYAANNQLLTFDVTKQASIREDQMSARFPLGQLIRLTYRLSTCKQFIVKLRLKRAACFTDHLVRVLNSLQILRPGSASTKAKEPKVICEQLVLNELYELEINILKLVANLICDRRLRSRLIKKSKKKEENNQLLKCILKNLVCFLASNNINQRPYEKLNKSDVLMIPFKCLYGLSCCEQIKEEIFKSRLVLRCLLDYLHLASLHICAEIGEQHARLRQTDNYVNDSQSAFITTTIGDDIHQIVLEASRADHYILGLWINLSARKSLPFYSVGGGDIDALRDLVRNQIGVSISSVDKFLAQNHRSTLEENQLQLIIYMHLKLLRNMTQFIDFSGEALLWVTPFERWMNQLVANVRKLLLPTADLLDTPMLVELLGIVTNLLGMVKYFDRISENGDDVLQLGGCENVLEFLIESRLIDLELMDTENDDLLMVSINFIGALAQLREICNQSKVQYERLVQLCLFVLKMKSTDTEMMISCLYALRELAWHSKFVGEIGAQLAGKDVETFDLINQLGMMLLHGDSTVAKLANEILERVKEFEEQLSLNESLASLCRFERYNNKWFQAIKADSCDETSGVGERDQLAARKRPTSVQSTSDDFSEQDEQHNLGQLKTIGIHETELNTRLNSAKSFSFGSARDDDDDNCCENDDTEDDDEEASDSAPSEPDSNVIDANSMIKHLTEKKTLINR